jgi:hypothetical protein
MKPVYRLGIKECLKAPRTGAGGCTGSSAGRRSAAKLLSKDEARRVTSNIAKLPVLSRLL